MVMFLLMMPIAGIGFLMKYALVSGVQRNAIYGNNCDLLYCGLDRHQWGSIHLILSVIFLVLLLLHIVLHWKMITQLFKKMFASFVLRITLVSFFILITFVFGIMPFFVKPEVCDGIKHHAHAPYQYHHDVDTIITTDQVKHSDSIDAVSANNSSIRQHAELPAQEEDEEHHHHSDINGQMTLHQLAEDYHISEKELCQYLGIPTDQAQERLGRLRKRYGFSIEDLRTYINNKD